jgi:gliding motility-associated-like protein
MLLIIVKKINNHNYFIIFTKFGLQNSKNFYPTTQNFHFMKKITLLLLFLIISVAGYSQLATQGFETPGPIGPLPSLWNLGSPEGDWAIFDNGVGTGQSWGINTVVAPPHSGVNFASVTREQIGAGNTSEDYLATPAVHINNTGITELHFWTRLFASGNQGTAFKVMVAPAVDPSFQIDPASYSDVAGGTWSELDLILPASNFNVWTEKTVDLTPYAGFDVYIAFVKIYTQPTGTLDGDRWLIDDVGINVQCTAPVTGATTAVTPTAATLTWSNPSGATSWNVVITPTAGGTPITFTGVANPFTIPDGTLAPNTSYTYQVSAICPTGFSSPPSNVSATFTTQILPPVCGGNLVDSGGTTGNYSNNENVSTTVTPVNAGDVVTVTFTSFNTATGDILRIYDGLLPGAPLLATLSGTTIPPSYTSTASGGQLTFVFTSNATTTATGYAANITCAPAPACRIPTAVSIVAGSITTTAATINWTQPANADTSVATVWDVVALPTGAPAPNAATVPTANDITGPLPYTLTGLSSAVCYDVYVRAVCNGTTDSAWSSVPVQVCTLVAPPVCNGNFVDSGGTTNNYANNATNLTTVIAPATPGDAVTVTFTAFNTELNNDTLAVYDGNGTIGTTLLGTFSGTTLPPSFTSSAPGGELTFVFNSNGTTTAAGWIAGVTCAPLAGCAAPTAISAPVVTHNTVQLNWTQPVNPDTSTATMWDIIVLTCGSPAPTAGSTPTQNDITVGTFPYILTGAAIAPNTCYDIYVRAVCNATTESAWITVPVSVTTLIAPPECGGNFVDNGGIAANYLPNSNVTTIICPTTPGDVVTVTFTAFNTEATWDALYVYNGNAVVPANLIPSANPAGNVPGGLAGGYWGAVIPCPFTSADANGCLTFVFRSDGSVQNPGWVADVTCGPPPTCATPTSLTSSAVTPTSATINWVQPANADTTVATTWDIFFQPCGGPAPTAATVPSVNDYSGALPYTLSLPSSGTCYNIYVRAVCGTSNSNWQCTPLSVTTAVAPPICGGNFVDNGGVSANYANSSNDTVTICPTNPGDVVTVTFTSFNTEATWDALYVYNGNAVVPANLIPSANPAGNVPGGLAGGYWGATIPCPFTSASADGCLTFVFRSDGSVNNPGWVANITCGLPPVCNTPSSVTSSTVTHNSVILNWVQPANADLSVASMWDIFYQPCGGPAPTAGSTPQINNYNGALPYTLGGLTPLTCYDIYVRAVCDATADINSAWQCTPTTITTLVAPPECGGVFTDAGGATGNYANNSNITTIICPPTGSGQIATLTFTSFFTEATWDGLYVYNGSGIDPANQIVGPNGAGNVPGQIPGSWWGNLTGANLPGPFSSTTADGCLTFVFRSDGSGVNPGWVADVTCTAAPTCSRPVITGAVGTTQTSTTINWTQPANPDGSVATQWQYSVLPAGSPPPTIGGINTFTPSIFLSPLTPGTAYVIYVRAVCSQTDTSTWAVYNFATLPTNDECVNATFAIVNQNLNCVQTTHGSLAGATASSPPTTCGGAGAANDDVWFTFTATTVTHVISFNNVTPATALSYAIYSGTCAGLTEVGCNSGANLVAGTTYYIRVFSTATGTVFTNFDLCIGTLPCTEAPAFCTGQTVTYANSTNVPSLGQIGCLFTSPNPAFFFLQVNAAGPLSYLISQVDTGGTPRDVDYVAWGPFTDLNTACTGVPANPLGQTVPIPTPVTGCPGTLHACSYSAAPQEIMCIPNAQLCEVYVIMITNFSNQAGTVTFTQTNTGGGTTACFPINTFNYPQTYYCQNQPDPTPVLSPGASAGVYSSTAGLVFVDSGTNQNSATGQVNLLASTPGAYVITSTSETTIGGTCTSIPFITTTRTMIITAPANATIAYAPATYCNSINATQPVTFTGTPGGTYSASPAGLLINSITGEIVPIASAPGIYTVTYTIPAIGGCPAYTVSTQVEILESPIIIQASVAACDTFTLPALSVGGYFGQTGGIDPLPSDPITATQPVFIYAVGTNGCITERQFTVTINTVPVPTYTTTDSTCTTPTGSITVTSPVSAGGAAPADLFISEVTDADTGSLTYVEIYNATGAAVNLNNYKLKFYTWGSPPTAENLQCDLALAGTIPNNATNVIKVSSNANISGVVPNQTFSSCAGVNNNDNIRLTTTADVLVDQWGPTDGSTFTPAGQSGYTYRRLNTATLPSTTWNPADWTSLDPEDYTNIGSYAMVVSNYEYILDNTTTQTNPLFDPVQAGTHSLVVRDVTTGCVSAPISILINAVNGVPTVATIDYATPVCVLSTTNPLPDTSATGFTSGGTYSVTPTTGLTVNPTTGEVDLSAPTTPGTYTIRYDVAFNPTTCESASFDEAIIVIDPATPAEVGFSYTTPICPIAQATLAPTLATGFVAGGTFTISPTTGMTIDPATGVLTLGASVTSGTYNITYTVAQNNANCQSATTSLPIQVVISPVTSPNVIFDYTSPVCVIAQATFAPNLDPGFTAGGTFTANPSTGITINASTGVISAATAGTYAITYTVPQNLANCQALTASAPIQIVITPATTPTVGFQYDTPVCDGETVNPMPILDAGFVTGGVFGPTNLVDPATGEFLLPATAGQTYTITYALPANTATCQNAGNSSATIAISTPILVELNGGCQTVYVLNAAPINGSFDPATATFSWHNAAGIEVGTSQSLDVPAVGFYTVVVTVNGCSTESAPFEVTTIACQIQRGISVNNDGFNDTFDLTGFDVKQLTIFNRLGMKVYTKGDYINEWGGKSDDGDELPDGTYFYVIDKNAGGTLTGWIYINRAQ